MTLRTLVVIGTLTASLLAPLSFSLVAQTKGASVSPGPCLMTESCNGMCASNRDCTLPMDSRSCGHSLSIFGTQIVINDPACEAAKASQNQFYAAQKSVCEINKATEHAECEIRRSLCLSVATACNAFREKAATSGVDGSRVLWVDDRPNGDVYERQALADLGFKVVLVSNAQAAMIDIQSRTPKIDVIISTFSRSYNPPADYSLLATVLKVHQPPPYIIYSAVSNATLVAEAKAKGAFGETDQVMDLFDLVIRAARKK
jgi:PleD family two-component response regulator